MSAGIKSLVLLAATLIVGFSLGLFADATLVARPARESARACSGRRGSWRTWRT